LAPDYGFTLQGEEKISAGQEIDALAKLTSGKVQFEP